MEGERAGAGGVTACEFGRAEVADHSGVAGTVSLDDDGSGIDRSWGVLCVGMIAAVRAVVTWGDNHEGKMLHAGRASERRGRSRSPATAASQRKWRSAADLWRSKLVARSAAIRRAVDLIATSTMNSTRWIPQGAAKFRKEAVISFSLVSRFVDEIGEALIFFLREFGFGIGEADSEGFFERTGEEGFENTFKCGFGGGVAANDWLVEVFSLMLSVTEVSLFFKDTKQGADGRVAWRMGEAFLDIGDGRGAASEEDIHNFTFPAGERRRDSTGHEVLLKRADVYGKNLASCENDVKCNA